MPPGVRLLCSTPGWHAIGAAGSAAAPKQGVWRLKELCEPYVARTARALYAPVSVANCTSCRTIQDVAQAVTGSHVDSFRLLVPLEGRTLRAAATKEQGAPPEDADDAAFEDADDATFGDATFGGDALSGGSIDDQELRRAGVRIAGLVPAPGRGGCGFHAPTIALLDERDEVIFALCGSHRLSKEAWGRPVKRKKQGYLRIEHWELAVAVGAPLEQGRAPQGHLDSARLALPVRVRDLPASGGEVVWDKERNARAFMCEPVELFAPCLELQRYCGLGGGRMKLVATTVPLTWESFMRAADGRRAWASVLLVDTATRCDDGAAHESALVAALNDGDAMKKLHAAHGETLVLDLDALRGECADAIAGPVGGTAAAGGGGVEKPPTPALRAFVHLRGMRGLALPQWHFLDPEPLLNFFAQRENPHGHASFGWKEIWPRWPRARPHVRLDAAQCTLAGLRVRLAAAAAASGK